MYYIFLSSALFTLRMSRAYLAAIILSTTVFFSSSAISEEVAAEDRQCVILLHGLARTSHSMDKMEQALLDAGYLTANIDYPSRTMKIQDLAAMAVKKGLTRCQSQAASQINFVTHSLGGILARYYLAENSLPQLGRVVMLAPPNKGSQVADKFRTEQWYRWLTGPAGQQLGTGKDGIPVLLGAVDYPSGIIAGDEHSPLDNWLAEIIPGEDDGKVSVEHAKVEGMSDFIVLPYNHISIMKQDEVIRQTLYFLRHGNFNHPG
ncbi:MAG: alpha/beta fold hydrolase [Gammaproteobacteria bacterium]|nr:MAG: alpha/beta fold hydrolase [Gammaproteobacteria bacterium]